MSFIRIFKLIKSKKSFKKWSKSFKEISYQIHFVNLGIKRGFLWDFGVTIDSNLFNLFILELVEFGIISNSLKVVTLLDEVFLINYKMESPNFVFVNVTKNTKPKIFEENSEIIWYKNFIHEDSRSISKLIPPENSCIPTLIGILIGFPVIYWYDNKVSDENCLGNVVLNVYQARFEECLTMSFSIPEFLVFNSSTVKNFIEKWINDLNQVGLSVNVFKTESSVIIL